MPDFTMCVSTECWRNNKCYRYRAIPEPKTQSYADLYNCGKFCREFIEIIEGDKIV